MERGSMDPYDVVIRLPLAVRFPVELEPPPAFEPSEPATWPHVDGRLEWVKGRLLYMPPSGDTQSTVATSLAALLVEWERVHPEFRIGGHEMGFNLDGDVRAADGVVVRKSDVGPHTGGYYGTAPILAVEVSGRGQGETRLREKARWYLSHGARVVWLLLCETREVVVMTNAGSARYARGARLPAHADLPGLEPDVDRFFDRLD